MHIRDLELLQSSIYIFSLPRFQTLHKLLRTRGSASQSNANSLLVFHLAHSFFVSCVAPKTVHVH
jgi:hypothetical protein